MRTILGMTQVLALLCLGAQAQIRFGDLPVGEKLPAAFSSS